MKLCVDIDQTLLFTEPIKDEIGYIVSYKVLKVNEPLIIKLNELFVEGHVIVLQTARHWDKLEITKQQIDEAGIKYTTLVMGNVTADYYVNDKGILPENFLTEVIENE